MKYHRVHFCYVIRLFNHTMHGFHHTEATPILKLFPRGKESRVALPTALGQM